MEEIKLPKHLKDEGIFFLNLIKDLNFGDIIKCGKNNNEFLQYFFYKLNDKKQPEEIKDKKQLEEIKNIYGINKSIKKGIIEG